MSIENPLQWVLVRRNVINPEGLKEIVRHMEDSQKEDLSVFDAKKSNQTGHTHWRTDKEVRDTQCVDMGPLFPKIKVLLEETVKNIINPFYDIEIDESEVPQLLSYGVGGHYKPHIDAESLWKAPDGEMIWKKSTDRDISMVFYLNDGYEGGDFIFPELGIRVRPEPGMLVAFPSTHKYQHGVEPVRRGMRYSMVCWATIKGFPKLKDINAELSKKYNIEVTN
tara:strand:+ start:8226 stop:8894 length:669 start_codon:yes stop_codon:yes gene_type:complete